MPALDEKIESLARDLPDAEGARLFFKRLQEEQPRAVLTLTRDAGLLSDALAIAAWSPLLATTLAQNSDYLTWLARERAQTRVKSREELTETLARFALTNSQLEPQVLLARFRRRELLRIYLHDIRHANTLVEVTEELSNLADAVLEYALNLARQELDNRYGQPECTDEKGRTATASFCIVALGKLGSLELNYASDIDLLFLYSDDGTTSGTGTRGETSNREYFNKLAERVARIVSEPSGAGAAYRVDLRLRPYGRDGALASSLMEAARYYRETAQAWERQALIRSRAAAGQPALYARFFERVRHRVYAADVSVEQALSNVRLAKQKIDRQHTHDTGGFNVKLGRGGIREIEFIAQALQLAFGGRDSWLRAPHTLISLGRLADRHLITERERSELSDAYVFLRQLEHRLQMEDGLQTHSVPDDEARRLLVARRMKFRGADALTQFNRALLSQTKNVRAAYDRVFGKAVEERNAKRTTESGATLDSRGANLAASHQAKHAWSIPESPVDVEVSATNSAAQIFARHLADDSFQLSAGETARGDQTERAVHEQTERAADESQTQMVARALNSAAQDSLNPRRALMLAARIASSLDKANIASRFPLASLESLVHLCGGSEFFGEMIASNPALIRALPLKETDERKRDYHALLRAAVESEDSLRAQMAALRREWSKLMLETGALDAAGAINMSEANARQTALAAASLDAGCLIARRELARRYRVDERRARVAVLGLGRLGGGGMDYGSDLDVVLIYDDTEASPIPTLEPVEAFARFSELLVAALSSVTREGFLYRVDLRLRPDGRNGATCSGARAFTEYLKERAVEWEWLAYVKLRTAAGDLKLGRTVEREARRIIHERARLSDAETLRAETRRVRERLEQERTKRRASATDIKYGAGGMLDVYFATRFLQLRDGVPDDAEDRSTRTMLKLLREAGSLDEEDYSAMSDGYAFLRALDHHLRLIIGRSTQLPPTEHPVMRDLARKLDYASAGELLASLVVQMQKIRKAYDHITKGRNSESRIQNSE